MNSSSLVSVGYDAANATMEIEFAKGRVYQYAQVREESYRALMSASSIGSHFHHHIRDKYPTTKIQ
ncbi:MAG: KTSC domain-containing protein [bacterium]|nr:KTSC domain-containing protein [bacterium]